MLDATLDVQQLGPTDQIIEFADTQLGHQLAHFLGDEEEEVDDMFGLTTEFPAQHGILCGNTDRTRIQMAFTHHDTAGNHKRSGSKTKLICTQHCSYHDVATGFDLA